MNRLVRILIAIGIGSALAGCACLGLPSGNAVLSAEKTIAPTSSAPAGDAVGVSAKQ